MKVRLGFVSNSSSSSFMCDLSYQTEGGYDCSPSDVGMVSCENGHTFMEEFKLGDGDFDLKETVVQFVADNDENKWSEKVTVEEAMQVMNDEGVTTLDEFIEVVKDNWDEDYGSDGCPAAQCPICMMHDLPPHEMFAYLIKKMGKSRQTVVSEIRAEFGGDISKFASYIKG